MQFKGLILNVVFPDVNMTYEGPLEIVVVYGNPSGSTDFGKEYGVTFPKTAENRF